MFCSVQLEHKDIFKNLKPVKNIVFFYMNDYYSSVDQTSINDF